MFSICPAKLEELPPLAQKAGGIAVRLDGANGLIGYAGVVQTSLIAQEYLMWFQLVGKPLRKELAEFRTALAAWEEWQGATIYATIERGNVSLERWARFMGFTYAGAYDSLADIYRRQ